jgi:hypothetical protein
MSTTPVENLDRDKYPALVALTEELGAIQQAATRTLNGAAQKLVVDGVKTATKRVQGDPLQVQRYSDLGQDPALAARVKLPTAFQLKVGAKGLRQGGRAAGGARVAPRGAHRQRALVQVPPRGRVRAHRGRWLVTGAQTEGVVELVSALNQLLAPPDTPASAVKIGELPVLARETGHVVGYIWLDREAHTFRFRAEED